VTAGPRASAEGIVTACKRLDCHRVVLADVGGDVLAVGDEPGLASPLCDAVMLATARHLPPDIEVIGCVIGAGCDAELTQAEVLDRVAALGRAGLWLGTISPGPGVAAELIEVAATVPTEASLCAARSALGESGPTPIRGGRRTVDLGPVAALGFLYDARAAIGTVAPLAEPVLEATSIEAARRALEALGIRTELDYEIDRAAGASFEEAVNPEGAR